MRRARSSTRRRPPRCCGRGRGRSASTRSRWPTGPGATGSGSAPLERRRLACRRRCSLPTAASALRRGPPPAHAGGRRAGGGRTERFRRRPTSVTSPPSTYTADPRKKGLDRDPDGVGRRAARAARSSSICRPRPAGRRRAARRALRRRCSPRPSTARCCAARACSSPRRAARTTASPSSRRWPTAASSSRPAAPGPYVALALARELDPRLVSDDLADRAARRRSTTRVAGYRERALELLAPFRAAAVDRAVERDLLPALLG